jgi:hypothetical protein
MEKSDFFMCVNRLVTTVVIGQAGQSNPLIPVQKASNEQFCSLLVTSRWFAQLYVPDILKNIPSGHFLIIITPDQQLLPTSNFRCEPTNDHT